MCNNCNGCFRGILNLFNNNCSCGCSGWNNGNNGNSGCGCGCGSNRSGNNGGILNLVNGGLSDNYYATQYGLNNGFGLSSGNSGCGCGCSRSVPNHNN